MTTTQLLLPAPHIAGLLPEWATPIPTHVIAPLYPLSGREESLLLAALMHHEQREAYGKAGLNEAAEWLLVPPGSRDTAGNLIMYGYLQKRTGKRFKRWFAPTEDGLIRARIVRERREAARNAEQSAPLALMSDQKLLEHDRRLNLARLTEELAHQGFVLYAEAGRGPSMGEQAFHNVFTGETHLYRCQLGRSEWCLRDGGYYKPTNDSTIDIAEQIEAMMAF